MKKLALCLLLFLLVVAPSQAAILQTTLLGIAAEHGGVGGQGPITTYENIVGSMLALSSGTGLLVVGGGKRSSDDVTTFWNRLASDLSVGVTFVNGPAAIKNQPFSGFALIVVVSSAEGTPSGGLTQAENDALIARQNDIAVFAKAGGAILVFSQCGIVNPYAYLEKTVGEVPEQTDIAYSDITPTQQGSTLGISDALDGCCWSEEYATSSFEVLATNAETGNPAAVRLLLAIDSICDVYPPNAIVGTEGNDVLIGTPGDDVIIGLGGDDILRGLGGNDILCGGPGNDRLYGEAGSDFLSGGSGDDLLSGGSGNDLLLGGDGDDVMDGEGGYDYLAGGAGNDLLKGGSGDDVMYGEDGSDRLYGEGGNDILDGGTGVDLLVDEVGRNVCVNGEQRKQCQ
jgi:Ca2+-binding RTX toxin-like protein